MASLRKLAEETGGYFAEPPLPSSRWNWDSSESGAASRPADSACAHRGEWGRGTGAQGTVRAHAGNRGRVTAVASTQLAAGR